MSNALVPSQRILATAQRVEAERSPAQVTLPDIDYLTPVVQIKPRVHRFSRYDDRGRARAICGEIMFTLFGEWNDRTRHVFRNEMSLLLGCPVCMEPHEYERRR